jgi:CBS domain-containing protein
MRRPALQFSPARGTEPHLPRLFDGNFVKEATMKVKDVMHRGATWVGPETPVAELARMMRDEDIGAIPIGEDDRLIGMVTDRDIVCRGLAETHDCAALTARDVLSKPILYCRTDEDVEDALRIMEENRIRRLPVIDDQKRLAGILALGDVSRKLGRDLTGEVMRSVADHHA